MISILDVLLTETTLVTKANPGLGRIWDRYRRGPRFDRILDWSNLGPPQRHWFHSLANDIIIIVSNFSINTQTLEHSKYISTQASRSIRLCLHSFDSWNQIYKLAMG